MTNSQEHISRKTTQWSRQSIASAVKNWVHANGQLKERDLVSRNALPSLITILRHFPEVATLNEFKETIQVEASYDNWNHDSAIAAGKRFIEKNSGSLKSHDLRKDNGLPTVSTIIRLFGTIRTYQVELGAKQWKKNRRVNMKEVDQAIESYFRETPRCVPSKLEFFREFPHGPTVIRRIFGNVERFFTHYDIDVNRTQ